MLQLAIFNFQFIVFRVFIQLVSDSFVSSIAEGDWQDTSEKLVLEMNIDALEVDPNSSSVEQ